MNTESLQTLSATVLGLGFVFTGVGGYGLYRFSRMAKDAKESPPVSNIAEAELRAKLSALQKENEELQERLRVSESRQSAEEAAEMPQVPVLREPAKTASANFQSPARPMPAAVKVPPPPALVDWAGASLLEEMIETSAAMEPQMKGPLSTSQRATIITVLQKYTGRAIAIQSVDGDSTGFEFARALKEAFVEAGWRVDGVNQVARVNPPSGLLITSGTASSPEETIIPHEALATAGLEVYRGLDSNTRSQTTVLLVGTGLK